MPPFSISRQWEFYRHPILRLPGEDGDQEISACAELSTLLQLYRGYSIIPEGMIKLPLNVGDQPYTSTVMNFLVVKEGSQFNVVIERPALRALRAITSIYHQLMKFPTTSGIGQVRGNQYESRLTYSDAVHTYFDPRRVPPAAEVRMVMTLACRVEEDLDPRDDSEKTGMHPIEELVEVSIIDVEPLRKLR